MPLACSAEPARIGTAPLSATRRPRADSEARCRLSRQVPTWGPTQTRIRRPAPTLCLSLPALGGVALRHSLSPWRPPAGRRGRAGPRTSPAPFHFSCAPLAHPLSAPPPRGRPACHRQQPDRGLGPDKAWRAGELLRACACGPSVRGYPALDRRSAWGRGGGGWADEAGPDLARIDARAAARPLRAGHRRADGGGLSRFKFRCGTAGLPGGGQPAQLS